MELGLSRLHEKLSFKNFFSKCDQIHSKLRIWSQLLRKSLTENFIFCALQNDFKNWNSKKFGFIKNDFINIFKDML